MPNVTQQLLEVFDTLDSSAQFCTAGSLPPSLPGLEVQGIGEIGLPIRPEQVKHLIRQAAPAPYGRGEETIVDLNVRRVWQIDPTQCTFPNPAWDTFLAEIVAAVKAAFGTNGDVQQDFYKLLIYEQGSFFAPHRDAEKTDGI